MVTVHRGIGKVRSEHVRSSQKPFTVGVNPRFEYEVTAGPPSVLGQGVEP